MLTIFVDVYLDLTAYVRSPALSAIERGGFFLYPIETELGSHCLFLNVIQKNKEVSKQVIILTNTVAYDH